MFVSVRCQPDLEGAVAGVDVLLAAADPVFLGGMFKKYEGAEEHDLALVDGQYDENWAEKEGSHGG